MPIEISVLMHNFLKASEENRISVTVAGQRKREVGLIVPGKYTAFTKDKRIAKVLNDELHKKKLKYRHLEFDFIKTESIVKSPFFT